MVVLRVSSSIQVPKATVVKVSPSPLCEMSESVYGLQIRFRDSRICALPKLDLMLTNITVAVTILTWKISNAADKVAFPHIDCDHVGQSHSSRGVLGMPECTRAAIDGTGC